MFVLQINVLLLYHTVLFCKILKLLKQLVIPFPLLSQQLLQLIIITLQLLDLFPQLFSNTSRPHDVTLCNFAVIISWSFDF